MVEICVKLLDENHKYKEDPAGDVAARCDPVYVGRLVSAMVGQCPCWTGSRLSVDVRVGLNWAMFFSKINSEDDHGVLEGRWGGPYFGGKVPTHWSGSHDILKMWLESKCHPVKYGQCWVFAAVMCSGDNRTASPSFPPPRLT